MTKANRRVFLKQVATAAGAASIGSIPGCVQNTSGTSGTSGVARSPTLLQSSPVSPASAPGHPNASRHAGMAGLVGYQSFGPEEAAFVEVMVNVMCPADNLTPNGVDCGLAIFMDRQLAGDFGKGARRYLRGPWKAKAGKPQHGYQSPLTPEQFFKAGIAAANAQCKKRFGKPFTELGAADADVFLNEVAAGKIADARVPLGVWFNDLVYPLFTQACFADPIYGGNVDKVFWKMIGYPGLPSNNTRNMVDFRGKPFPGAKTPKSIADFS
ncbi:gluconate 2-dehydrogenase subunit 3 family protein [Pendulispora albinea]|uniref:Gluconate 2-dehydrogenase subunit 3 family protein n=1 Tax=Pendulispora albinea TaxID=2741071 RepID=A0ABZ2LSK0_9BACT